MLAIVNLQLAEGMLSASIWTRIAPAGMVLRMSDVLDFSTYVEVRRREFEGGHLSCPSEEDVARTSVRLGLLLEPEGVLGPELAHHAVDVGIQRLELFRRLERSDCPYCRVRLRTVYSEPETWKFPLGPGLVDVRSCPTCGWWRMRRAYAEDGGDLYWIMRSATLREFDVAAADVPINTLRDYLTRHHEELHAVDPIALERMVGAIFADYMNCEAVHVGGPGDAGVDLILVEGDHKYMVQVKRRASAEAAERVSLVREFLGALVLQQAVRGLIVTTASHFSSAAKAAAAKAIEVGVVEQLDLIDGPRLASLCRLWAPTPCWETLVEHDPSVRKEPAGFWLADVDSGLIRRVRSTEPERAQPQVTS